jgi:hypothetical protein
MNSKDQGGLDAAIALLTLLFAVGLAGVCIATIGFLACRIVL